jgi:hypothetical protein
MVTPTSASRATAPRPPVVPLRDPQRQPSDLNGLLPARSDSRCRRWRPESAVLATAPRMGLPRVPPTVLEVPKCPSPADLILFPDTTTWLAGRVAAALRRAARSHRAPPAGLPEPIRSAAVGARHRRRGPAHDPRSSPAATLLPQTTSGTPGVISSCQLREGDCTSMPWQALCRRMRTVAPYLENVGLRLRCRPGRGPAADRHGRSSEAPPLVMDRGTRADATGAIRALVRVRRRRCARCARIRDRAPRSEARGPAVAPSWCDRL